MKPERVNILRAATLAMVMLLTGCASPSKPFPIVEAAPGIFVGVKPRTAAHYEALHAQGIRTILSFEDLPWNVYPESRAARKSGFVYFDVPIFASPLEPNEARVKEALLALSAPPLRPIFVHCLLGQDRTAFVVGLYRVYYQDWTPEAAWADMLRLGFHVRLTLRGFETYFWKHTSKPDWAVQPPKEPSQPQMDTDAHR